MWEWKLLPKSSRRRQADESPARSERPKMLAFMRDPDDRDTVTQFADTHHWDATVHPALSWERLVPPTTGTALVLLDCDLTDGDWQRAVRGSVRQQTPPCVVLVSHVADEYLFEEIVKQGGFDVVVKPLHADELRRIARLALAYWKNRVASDSK